MRRCPGCSSDVPPGALACAVCGRAVSDPSAPTITVDARPFFGTTRHDDDGGQLQEVVARELANDYDVLDQIGRGGMAVVFRARERELGRIVALKVLLPELALGGTMPERFKREARMAAALDHPNIIPIYRVGQSGKVLFIAMKFIEGRVLDEIIQRQGPLPVPVALHVLRGAAAALAYAHDQGIVHRDVKGANILIQRDGRPLVSDFGVARGAGEKSMTATGAVMGTPYYMSPEQCAGKQTGPQSDQYSLGVLAFQMLTGAVPFDSETLPGIMQHHWFTPVPDIALARDDVPPELLTIIDHALAKSPRHRFSSTIEMARALDAVPLSEKEKEWGDAMLGNLARGVSIPVIATRALPPLQPGVHVSQPMRTIRRRQPSRRPMMLSISAVAVLIAAASLWRFGAFFGGAGPAEGLDGIDAASTTLAAGGGPDLRPDSAPRVVVPAARPESRPSRPRDERSLPPAAPAAPVAQAAPAGPAGPARIRVRTDPPDAEIELDGQLAGRGVLLDYELPPGRHRMRVSAPGYAVFDTTITFVSGRTEQLGRLVLPPRTP